MEKFILLAYLGVLAWMDYSSRKIPNRILKQLFWIRTVLLILEAYICENHLKNICLPFIMGFLASGGIFFLFYLISRGGIGAGDVKLFAVIGYYLGSDTTFELIVISFFLCAVVSVFLLCWKKIQWKSKLPFVPFVLAGMIIQMLC